MDRNVREIEDNENNICFGKRTITKHLKLKIKNYLHYSHQTIHICFHNKCYGKRNTYCQEEQSDWWWHSSQEVGNNLNFSQKFRFYTFWWHKYFMMFLQKRLILITHHIRLRNRCLSNVHKINYNFNDGETKYLECP